MKPLIQYQIPQYQPLSGMVPPITIRQFQGVNTFDALMIPETMFTDASNLTSNNYPTAEVRPGYTVLGNTTGNVLGLGVWKNQELHMVLSDGTWRRWDGTTWNTIASGLNTSARCYFTNFQGNLDDINLFMTNGVDQMRRYDGTSVSTVSGAPAGSNFIVNYQNRLWIAFGKEIRACALDQPEVWNKFDELEDDSYGKDIESSAGENINMLSGGLYRLTIGFPSSIRLLFGSLPSDFNDRLITEDEGFASNSAWTTQEGNMRFLHKTGIYEYEASTNPDHTFSDIVKRYLPSISTSSVAGTDGERLYFFLQDGKMLFYDPREGINAWYPWDGIRATCFAVMNNDLYIGTDQGKVLKLGASDTDNGTPISWYAITKPFSSATTAQKNRWIKIWCTVELAAGSTLNISLSDSVDGDDFVQVGSVSGTGLGIQRVIIPVRQFALANFVRIKFEGTGWARLHEITYQARVLPLY